MGDMLSKTSHKKKDPAIDQEFFKEYFMVDLAFL